VDPAVVDVALPYALDHVGFAVRDLDAAVARYRGLLGARLVAVEEVPRHGVREARLELPRGGTAVQLLAATGDDTPVGRFLAKRGEGMHHIAYEVADVEAALAHLSEQGVQLIDARPRHGMFGLEVAFVHPESVHGVLSEVVSGG
jgi:methylmalonyl-CoA/ethylmalonyl-CoA epimerase